MLNEERIRLMTRMSVYDKNEGARGERVNAYFMNDYIASHLLRTFVCVTIAYVLLAAIYVLYNFEDLMLTIYSIDLVSLLKTLALRYVVFLLIFSVLTVLIYYYRYRKVRKALGIYYRDLRALQNSYKEEKQR